MTWSKVCDTLPFHRKTLMAGNEAMGVWVRALAWSSSGTTNGQVPEQVWQLLVPGPRWRKIVAALEAAGLLDKYEGGWELHDFLFYNPSRTAVLDRKAKRAELRGSDLTSAVKRRDRGRCRYCRRRCDWKDRKSAKGGTYDHVIPGLAVGPDNLVVACRGCNGTKARRTPEQAGMVLLPEWADDEVFPDDEAGAA